MTQKSIEGCVRPTIFIPEELHEHLRDLHCGIKEQQKDRGDKALTLSQIYTQVLKVGLRELRKKGIAEGM